MSEEKPFDFLHALKVDEKKKYHLQLPTGEEEIIELTNEEIETVENWFELFGKHTIRYDIENILQIHNELNATQISHMLEQSKATVARHLRSMEKDGLLVSQKPYEYDLGRIPPKLYQLNRKLHKIVQSGETQHPQPSDPKKLMEFYQREINKYRTVVYQFMSLLKKMSPLLDMLENKLSDLNGAKQIYADYFDTTTSKTYPVFGYTYVSEKYIDKFMEEFIAYTKKVRDILVKQNSDPEVKERVYAAFCACLPIGALIDIYRKEILDK